TFFTAETPSAPRKPSSSFSFLGVLGVLGVSAVQASLFLAIVNHGADFRSEFFLHALHDWILFGAAASASVRCCPAWRGYLLRCCLGCSAGFDLHPDRSPGQTAGGGGRDAARVGGE